MLLELFKSKLNQINPTTLLTGMGVTGVFSTAYLTGRASFKAASLIEKDKQVRARKSERSGEELVLASTKEKIKLVWPLYVPAISIGATTVTSIVMANHTASKKIAALTVASGISERALQEYKSKVLEKLGENKEQAIRDEIAQDRVNLNPPTTSQVMMVGEGDMLCYDMLTGRYFNSSAEKLRKALNDLNYEIIAHEYASLSFFYDLVGLAPTAYSDFVGWRVDDHPDLSFSTTLSPDSRPCLAVDFDTEPHSGYNKMW